MDSNVGVIEYDARITTKKLRADAAEADRIAKDTGDNLGSGIEKGSGRASAALEKFAAVAKAATIASGLALAGGLLAASKASWDQVGAVEQATVALNAYEKDGSKVNAVLKDLIGYARSDLGVLFNRRDLFESAQSLKIMGDKTENLVDHVQILSRSVGLGLSNWDDLNMIVGRVGSTGRLTGIDFDNLTKAGFVLDTNLRNTTISFDELFKQLDKGIPVGALAGQANTIKGLGIRIQTAFRGVGDAVLGVDSDTSKFIEGGLGDRLTKGIGRATELLKDFKKPLADLSSGFITVASEAIPRLIESARELAEAVGAYLGPKFAALGRTISQEVIPLLKQLWNQVIAPFAPVIGGLLVGAIGLAVDAFNLLIRIVKPIASFLITNKDVIITLAAALGVLAIALKVWTAVDQLRVAFTVLQVVTIPALLASLGTLVAFMATPMGLALLGLSLLAAAVTANFLSQKNQADQLKTAQDNLKLATDGLKQSQDALSRASLNEVGAALAVEQAQLGYNKAVAEYGPDSLEARQALYNLQQSELQLKDAQDSTKKSQKELHDKQLEVARDKELIKHLMETRDNIKGVGDDALEAGKKIQLLNGAKVEVKTTKNKMGTEVIDFAATFGGRAAGGSVIARRPYIVGENRDGTLNKTSELFVPRSAGNIVNSKDLQSALGGGNSSNVTVNVDMAGIMARSKTDERDIAKNLIKRVNEELQAKGQPILGGGAI